MQFAAVRSSSVEPARPPRFESIEDRVLGPGKKLLQQVKEGGIEDLLQLYETGGISEFAFRDTINWGLKETRGDCAELRRLLRVRLSDLEFREYLRKHCSVLCPEWYRER